jgi:hypothetical protein
MAIVTSDEKYRGAPVHPLSAILTIILDYIWTLEEVSADITIVGIALEPFLIVSIALIDFIGVFLVQKFIAHDSTGASAAKAFFMAIIAGVPFPVTSTVFGGVLLTWAGASFVSGKIKALNSVSEET